MDYLKISHGYWRGFVSSAILSMVWTGTIVGVGSLAMVVAPPAIAQDAFLKTLTVTGRGNEAIVPTLAEVEVGVEVQRPTAQEAQQEVARRASAVVALLQSKQVEKLQTTGVQLNPQYKYDNGESRLVGYSASNTVRFRVPTAQVGPLLDQTIGAGASQIQGIRFVATDAAIAAARQKALAKAVQDAQQQATAVFSALSLMPKEVVSIQIDGASSAPPMPLSVPRQMAVTADAKFSTPVVAGEQTIEAAVTLQIRY